MRRTIAARWRSVATDNDSCRQWRRRFERSGVDHSLLSAGGGAEGQQLTAHLKSCPACTSFVARHEALTEALRTPQNLSRPDAGFPARVCRRLPNSAGDQLSSAALRLLPLAACTLAVLALWSAWRLGPTGPAVSPMTSDGSSVSEFSTNQELLLSVAELGLAARSSRDTRGGRR